MEEKKSILTQILQSPIYLGILIFLLIFIPVGVIVFSNYLGMDKVIIDGKSYTLRDIKKEYPSLYSKYASEEYELKRQIFSEFAEKKALELATKKGGFSSVEEFLKNDFNPTEFSDSDLLAIYNQYKSQLQGRSFQDTKELIRKQLKLGQERQFEQNKKRELFEQFQISYRIKEPPPVRHNIGEGGNPAIGPESAKITVIEFSDFECPFCKRSQDVNKKLREKYKGQIRWVFRDFPLDFHENAMYAHMAANCAIPQGKYWEFFELLFENSGNLTRSNVDYLATKAGLDKEKYQDCLKNESALRQEIENDIREGQSFGVTGTPAFFINGIYVSGALPFEYFDDIIQKELK